MVEIQTGFRENTVGMVEKFAEVAAVDPLVAVLLVLGGILTAFAAGFFGVLSIGAVGKAITRGLSGSEEPIQRAR